MHLTVSLVEGISYAGTAPSLPFLYQIVFEESTTICGAIHVTACILATEGNDEAVAGYVKNISSLIPGTERLIEAGTELVLAVDALEHEDDPSALKPGRYEVSAKISVRVKSEDGALRHQELRASQQLVLL